MAPLPLGSSNGSSTAASWTSTPHALQQRWRLAGTAQLGFSKRRRAATAAVRAAASSDVEAAPLRNKTAAPAAGSSDSISSSNSRKSLSWLQSKWDKDIWQLAVPAALALAADPLLGMVDTALVGRLGSDELAALGINTSLFSLSFILFNFLATATTPAVATAVSSSNNRAAGETIWQATSLAVLLGLLVSAAMLGNGRWMLEMMGADQSQQHMQDLALQYLWFRAFAAPAVLLTTVGQGVFRGISNMRAPLLITLATNAVHLGLDLVLMFPCGLGIKGAAISTAVSEWLAAGAYVTLVWGKRDLLGLWPPPQLQPAQLKERCLPFLQAGSAVVLRTGSLLGTKTLATAVAARLGPGTVASHQVLMQLWVLASMLVDSLAVSGQTLVAVNLGQGQKVAAREISERLLQLGLGTGVLLSALMLGGSPWWPQLFTSDERVLGTIRDLVPLVVLPLPVNALVYTLDGVLVGCSDWGYLMKAMVGASAVAASMLVMVEPSGAGLEGVWSALAVLMVGRLVTLGWRYQSNSGPLPPQRQQQQQQLDVASLQQQQQLLLQELSELAAGADESGGSKNRSGSSKGESGSSSGEEPALLTNSVPGSQSLQARRCVAEPTAAAATAGKPALTTKYSKVHNGFGTAAAAAAAAAERPKATQGGV